MATITSIEKVRPNININPHTMTMKKWLAIYYDVNRELNLKNMSNGR